MVSLANTPFATTDTTRIRSSRPVLFCKKVVLTNFAKFTRKHQKEIRRHICFLVNSAKILITSFLKNPSGGCFSINIRSVYYPTMTSCIFKNDVIHIFWLFFYGLICRLGTRVSSIFQVLSQKPIFIPIEHLRWSFFCENI